MKKAVELKNPGNGLIKYIGKFSKSFKMTRPRNQGKG
jgi:hypothetical protein